MFVKIRAKDGYILTDGVNYAETFDLAENTDVDKYYEITQEEYEKIMEADELL